MVEYSEDYTVDEIFITALAQQFADGERAYLAVEVPLCLMAWMVAKETHAPHSEVLTLAGGHDPQPTKLPMSTVDPQLYEGALCNFDITMQCSILRKGLFDIIFLSGVQIDKHGNANNSVIGSYYKPKVRLPGGAGGGEQCHLYNKFIYFRTKHTRKIFVERVDFITYVGWMDNVTWRRNGPSKVITPLCVMGFDKKTKLMMLESVYPGVTLEEVQDNTGFDLLIPEKVPTTEPPTKKQIELIRTKIDPEGLRKAQFQ